MASNIASKTKWLQTEAGKKYGPAGYSTYVSNMQKYNASRGGSSSSSKSSSSSRSSGSSSSSRRSNVASKSKWLQTDAGKKYGPEGYDTYLSNMAKYNQGGSAQSSGGGQVASQSQWMGDVFNKDPANAKYWASRGGADAAYQVYLKNMGQQQPSGTGVGGSVRAPMQNIEPVQQVRTTPGFVWKPRSERDGNLVVLGNYPGQQIDLVDEKGNIIERGQSYGPSNSRQRTVRFSRPGGSYGNNVFLRIGGATFKVANPGRRYENDQLVGTTGGGMPSDTARSSGASDNTGNYSALNWGGKVGGDSVKMVDGSITSGQTERGIPFTYATFQVPDNYREGHMQTARYAWDGQKWQFVQGISDSQIQPDDRVPRYLSGAGPDQGGGGGQQPAPAPTGGGGGGGGGGTGRPTASGGYLTGSLDRPEISADSRDADPVTRQVVGTEDQNEEQYETVRGQMEDMLDDDSPYLRQAVTTARQEQASRGLLNTSRTVEAAENARIRAALPIAQQDASTYFSQAIQNQNTVNQFNLANLNAINQADAVALANYFDRQRMERAHELGLENLSISNNFAASQNDLSRIASILATPGATPQQIQSGLNMYYAASRNLPNSYERYRSMGLPTPTV